MRYPGISNSVLDAIGDTPMLEIDGVFAKLEFMNPSGSIKARIAWYMVEKAEQQGLLKPGDTIVEATSGNTGNALSMVAAVKGYRMLVVMPEGLSNERVAISRAYGEISTHHIEGISDGFVPGIFARHSELVDSTLSVSSEDAIAEMRRLARGHGLLCGPSSGAHLVAARRVREQHPDLATVVTLFCDEGEKYLQDHFTQPDADVVRSAFD